MTPNRHPSLVLGLTGGIGSGKSTVAELFQNRGAEIIDADAVVHSILDRPSLRKRLVAAWGKEIQKRGRIDREALAKVAFRDLDSVRKLNEIVHPVVRKEVVRAIRRSRSPLIVLDAPLLLEVGADRDCHKVVFVDAPLALRIRRVAKRGWTPSELRRREKYHWPMREKRKKADFVIDNRGSRAALERQVRALLDKTGTSSHL
jgi:dephospho-CoA kinase